jgi:hypothetical protein
MRVGHLGKVRVAEVDLGRDRQVAELGKAAADILDVSVDSEDFLVHQDDGEAGSLRRAGVVGRQLAVRDRDLHFAGVQAGGVGVDRLGLDPLSGQREAADQAGHHEAASRQRISPQAADLGHVIHARLLLIGCEFGPYPVSRASCPD